MKFNDLNVNAWKHLDENGDIVSGYEALFLNKDDKQESGILIFKDENKKPHFVIADSKVCKEDLFNPRVRGLNINLRKFKFRGREIEQFIDLEIGSEVYIEEFTEIVKEISSRILVKNIKPIDAVKAVVYIWKSFWGIEKDDILSEEAQIGLICELNVLKKICVLSSPEIALNSWRGPLKEKYDFLFPKWVFEVKGTQKNGHIHIISGIEQLNPPADMNLALISFLVSKSNSTVSKSLEDSIAEVLENVPSDRIDLLDLLYELLVSYGYNKIHSEIYKNIKYNVYDGMFYIVKKEFPRITREELKEPLNSRISDLRYTIDLNGLNGYSLENMALGEYLR